VTAEETSFEKLLQFLRQERGFDFSGYKRPSLMRRVSRRMETLQVQGFEQYVEYLEVHPEEFAQLFNSILINVTSFFRDPAPWDYLRANVIPRIVQDSAPNGPIRVWSAGCASGEEAYTLAMLFAQEAGEDAFRERIKIYATDVDEEALNQARLASYSAKDLEPVAPELRDRFFEPQGSRYVFRNDLRRSVIFGRHDLVQDAPISRLDLLVCRNTLMYFNSETQARILQRFHFALGENGSGGGFLLLGRAEMLLTHSSLFTPLEMKLRLFKKVPQPGARPRPAATATPAPAPEGGDLPRTTRLRDLAMEESPLARIVIDADGILQVANQRARVLFSLNTKDIGRSFHDLEISYRPLELRSLIEQAYAERRAIAQANVERRFTNGEAQYLNVAVTPLLDDTGAMLGVSISFLDSTQRARLQEELQRSREEVQTASEELQSSNEELETTNEELQSSNEELETTNEELQSTNEELETMNEELQSSNEELQTVNEELRQRTDELNQANAFLESVLSGLRAAAIVVDAQLNILMWNTRAYDMWGLTAEETRGKSITALDIGLPVGDLREPLLRAVQGSDAIKDLEVQAINRRGKTIRCRLTTAPLTMPDNKRRGAIVMIEEIA
jgi:two-component system CheB/CheR fusion protein